MLQIRRLASDKKASSYKLRIKQNDHNALNIVVTFGMENPRARARATIPPVLVPAIQSKLSLIGLKREQEPLAESETNEKAKVQTFDADGTNLTKLP